MGIGMKRKKGILILLFSAALIIWLTCFYGKRVRLSDIYIDDMQLEKLLDNRTCGNAGMAGSLYFDGQKLMLDEGTDTFYYSIVEGSKTAYNPYVTLDLSENGKISLAISGESLTEEAISGNKTFKLIAYDNDKYYQYNLKCTTLPLMNINCEEEIVREYVSMNMTLFDNRSSASCRLTESEGKIHVRGASTVQYPKKGYRISLTKDSLAGNERTNKVSLLGMRQDDDWLLYAAYNDSEKIRNVFSSKLWKETCAGDNSLGIDNGMEYQYLELFINNEYWGLYALGYPIDELALSLDTKNGERLYKKPTWESEGEILSNADEPITGYETDESEPDAWKLLNDYYTTLHFDWQDSDRMYAGIDIDNSIDMYLFINLIQGIDHAGGADSLSIKNMYISFHNTDDGQVALYTPWDMDVTWGMKWTGASHTNLVMQYGTPADQNVIMGLGNLSALILNGDDNVWDLILTKYRTLRSDLWSEENLDAIIDEYEEDIYFSGAYSRDMQRWQNGSYSDVEKGLSDFRRYVKDRLLETDQYYMRIEKFLLEEEYSDNAYIMRSIQYKDFLNSDCVLILNDKSLLENDDYKVFLEYTGFDMDKLNENVQIAILNGRSRQAEYFTVSDINEAAADTGIGIVRIEKNPNNSGSFMLYVDDVLWREFDMNTFSRPMLMFKSGDNVESFDFKKEYVMWTKAIELENPQIYCDELKSSGYDVIIEILNHNVAYNDRFKTLIKGFGADASLITADCDFIAIKTSTGEMTVLNNAHVSGTRAESVLGELSIFYNDAGGYGVYRDAEECILVNSGDNEHVDIRMAVITCEPYQVIRTTTVQYE